MSINVFNVQKAPMTPGEYSKLLLAENEKQQSLTEQANRVNKSIADREEDVYKGIMESLAYGEQQRSSFSNFSTKVKTALLTECLSNLFNKSIGYKYESSIAESVKNKLITDLIEEAGGVDKMVSDFKYKSVLLSEYAHIIDKYHGKILEGCDAKVPATFEIEDKFKKEFFDDLNTTDTESIAQIIKSRTTTAIEDFIAGNMANKLEIKDILDDSQARIASIKTVKDPEDKEIQESAIMNEAKIKINKVRSSKPKSVFNCFVESFGVNCLKDQALKESYVDDKGKLDMESIMESCEMIYTFLEMANTAKIIDMDADYIHGVIKNFK